jgi:hypothetical protein
MRRNQAGGLQQRVIYLAIRKSQRCSTGLKAFAESSSSEAAPPNRKRLDELFASTS